MNLVVKNGRFFLRTNLFRFILYRGFDLGTSLFFKVRIRKLLFLGIEYFLRLLFHEFIRRKIVVFAIIIIYRIVKFFRILYICIWLRFRALLNRKLINCCLFIAKRFKVLYRGLINWVFNYLPFTLYIWLLFLWVLILELALYLRLLLLLLYKGLLLLTQILYLKSRGFPKKRFSCLIPILFITFLLFNFLLLLWHIVLVNLILLTELEDYILLTVICSLVDGRPIEIIWIYLLDKIVEIVKTRVCRKDATYFREKL